MTAWIGTMMDTVPPRTKDEEKLPAGTHQGHLTPEKRAERRTKNLRNRSRRGQAVRTRGSSHRPFQGHKSGTGAKSSRNR